MKLGRKPRPLSALQLAAQTGNPALLEAVEQSQKLLHRKALMAALASATPVPGLDMAVDAALLSRLIPQISNYFGLSDEQIARLTPAKRAKVQNTVNMLGGVLVGKLITKDVILRGAKALGAPDGAAGQQICADCRPGGVGCPGLRHLALPGRAAPARLRARGA